jgi:alpha-amylase/alpha-mannosidase (GH57 family)
MHQPYYLDPETGESVLPWVRLHALKDYWGMVALVDECPGMRATFNMVPSLVEQVEAYAQERTWDRQLVLGLREADALDRAEAEWFIREGFHAHPPTMVDPYPRYAELWRLQAGERPFDLAALRDLQIWQKLAWVDPDIAAIDPRVQRLLAKGRHFDEHDKHTLRAVELEVLRRIVPAYTAAAARGQLELSTSPYFHPILPLLCASAAHHDAHPGAPLPEPPFIWPADADAQLARAIDAHTRWFGQPPRGVWPSEGSVSPAAADAIARAGFQWMATDEDILKRSRALAGEATPDVLKFRAHAFATPHGDVRMLFRDHGLSDAIGFVYQSWPAEPAVDDFVGKLRAIGAHCAGVDGGQAIVPIILDGENAWEHYAGGGRPFLRALYRRLAEAPDIEPVTMHEATSGEVTPLTRLFAGSWIHADFGIWIGHADDRRAWTQLGQARARLEAHRAEITAEAAAEAMDALQAAEGSDWFWWYGDDHSSAHDRDFDALFRRHLRRAWRAMGVEPPEELHRTNITTAVAGDDVLRLRLAAEPAATTATTASYFARLGAAPLERSAGSMHRVGRSAITRCDAGATTDGLVLWVEAADGVGLAVESVVLESGATPVTRDIPGGRVVIPWEALGAGAGPGTIVRLRVVARDTARRIVETVPADGLARRVELPGVSASAAVWTA